MRYRTCILVALVSITFACNMPAQKPAATATSAPTNTSAPPAEVTEAATDLPPATQPITPTPPPPTTAAPAGSSTPEPPSHGALLYETRFLQGWLPLTGDKAAGASTAEGYQIDVTQPWSLYAFTSRSRQASFFATITARPLQCPEGHGGYGMVFGYQSDTAYRVFMIWCSGRYSLLERDSGSSVKILGEGELPEGLTPASGEHTLGVHALNNKLAVYVDNQQITKVDVSSLPTGDFGPYAETTGDPISVLFIWLSIYAAG